MIKKKKSKIFLLFMLCLTAFNAVWYVIHLIYTKEFSSIREFIILAVCLVLMIIGLASMSNTNHKGMWKIVAVVCFAALYAMFNLTAMVELVTKILHSESISIFIKVPTFCYCVADIIFMISIAAIAAEKFTANLKSRRIHNLKKK